MTSNIDFSVVMPVRNNVDGLRVTLGAFNLFTVRRDRLEVILVVDDDDPDASFYHGLKCKYGFDIRVLFVKRSDNFCRDYYNAGANIARGANIMVYNDDCYMQTYGWDDIIRFKIEKNKHFRGIYLIALMDSTYNDTPEHPFPRFPMISRKAVELIGFFFYPQVRMWPADKVIWDLYKHVGCVITAHEVKMCHNHNYNHDTDPSKNKMLKILEEDKANGVFPVNADREARLLSTYINTWSDRPDMESCLCGNGSRQ